MAEICGFFDAHVVGDEYDRVYLADNFARYFASFISNGVFGGNSRSLLVKQSAVPGLTAEVEPGQAWENGYWYENDSVLQLKFDVCDGVLNRIDSVVLQWGKVARDIHIVIKKGDPSSRPVPKALVRNSEFYEIKIADVMIRAGAVELFDSDITDTRFDKSVCGQVTGVVHQIDTTYYGYQLNSFIKRYIAKAETEYTDDYIPSIDKLKAMAREYYDAFVVYIDSLKNQSNNEFQSFIAWIASYKTQSLAELKAVIDQLSGLISSDVAAELNARINALEKKEPNTQIASITHNLNDEFIKCDVFEYQFGAGCQGAGEGPAGGGNYMSVYNFRYEMESENKLKLFVEAKYGTVSSVSKVSDTIYAVAFNNNTTSLLIILRKQGGNENACN